MNSSQLNSPGDLSSPSKLGMSSKGQGLLGGDEVEFDPKSEQCMYVCNIQGCERRFGTKAKLSNHKRGAHWVYHECTICQEKDRGKDVYILDRKEDIGRHFQDFHPNIGRDLRDRFLKECSAKEDHELVKKEKDLGASQSHSQGAGTSRKEKKVSSTGSGDQAPSLGRLKSLLKQRDEKIEILQSAVNCVEDDKQIIDQKLTEKEEELDKVLVENEELREAICSKKLDFKKLKEDHKSLQKLCAELEVKQVALMEAQIGLPVDVERDYQEKVAQLEETLEEYKIQMNAYRDQESNLEVSNAMLRDNNERLKKRIDVVVGRCKRRDVENARLRGIVRVSTPRRVSHPLPPRPHPRPILKRRSSLKSTSNSNNSRQRTNRNAPYCSPRNRLPTLDEAVAASRDDSQGYLPRYGDRSMN